jgi:hypothetical protein
LKGKKKEKNGATKRLTAMYPALKRDRPLFTYKKKKKYLPKSAYTPEIDEY